MKLPASKVPTPIGTLVHDKLATDIIVAPRGTTKIHT